MNNYHNYGPIESKRERVSKPPKEYVSHPDELIEISDEVSQYFPQSISDTRLVLMEIDPYKAHAYWNINERDLAQIQKELGEWFKDAQLVLRMYDISCIHFDGTNAHSHFDMEVHGLTNNWYIDLWSSGKSYCAELGFRLSNGNFHTIAHSNIIHTPRDSESPVFESKGLLIAEGAEDVQEFDDFSKYIETQQEEISTPSMTASDSECVEAIRDYYGRLLGFDQREMETEGETETVGIPMTEYMPVEAVHKHGVYSDLAEEKYIPSEFQDRSFEQQGHREEMEKVESLHIPPEAKEMEVSRPTMDMPTNECMEAIESYYEKILGLDGKNQETGVEAADEQEEPTESLYEEKFLSTHPTEEEDSLADNQLTKETFQEVEAEIYIHGRAKPGTNLNFGGQVIPVEADGTFSVRYPVSHEAVHTLLGTAQNEKERDLDKSKEVQEAEEADRSGRDKA